MSSPFEVKAEKGGGGDYEVPPAENHPAVLVGLIDLGTQRVEYANEVKWMRKIYLIWELTACRLSGTKERNHVVGRDYTLTFGEKSKLRGLIESWFNKKFAEGQPFDLIKLLGRPCLLTIVHGTSGKGNVYAKIDSITAVPKGMTVPPAQQKALIWSIGEAEPVPTAEWVPFLYGRPVKEVIEDSQEYRQKRGQTMSNGSGQHAPVPATPVVPVPVAPVSVPSDIPF